jgi:hypothetical protein
MAQTLAMVSGGKTMATIAERQLTPGSDERFFMRAAIAMTVIVVAGFSLDLALGRSTFASPPLLHAHAITFMGWVFIYLLQNIFVATGRTQLHRRLGWVGAVWIVAMVVLGTAVTVAMVRRADVPFFFRPLQFLILDPVTVLTFAGLTYAAIVMRRRTDWHRRLHYCGMSMLLAPAFGRLLPVPLFMPWVFESLFAVILIFPAIGMWSDIRRNGRAHPAWGWGMMTMIGAVLLTEAITYSPVGSALYNSVTAGSPGAAVPPLEFPPLPPGF